MMTMSESLNLKLSVLLRIPVTFSEMIWERFSSVRTLSTSGFSAVTIPPI